MLFVLICLALAILIPGVSFLLGLHGQLRKLPSTTSPHELRTQAIGMADHAGKHGLPLAPWYELAAFWEQLEDYGPEVVRPEIDRSAVVPLVIRGPGMPKLTAEPKPTEQHVWTLSGTAEDDYVIEALRNHGVSVRTDLATEGKRTACLVGTRAAIVAAEAEYRHGLVARRATTRP